MSYPIRQRPSSVALLLRDRLRDGLEAVVDALNADLADASAPYRLPPFGGTGDAWGVDDVVLRVQEGELPDGLRYPHVRVVPLDGSSRQDASSRSGLTLQTFAVAAYIDAAAINASKGAVPASPVTQDATEQEVLLGAMDLANACARVLRDPAAGVFSSTAGSVRIAVDAIAAPRVHYVPASDVRASAVWCALRAQVEIEETY